MSYDTALPITSPQQAHLALKRRTAAAQIAQAKNERTARGQVKRQQRAAEEVKRLALLPADTRSAVNETLPPGYACAVNRPPGKPPQLVIVRLPKSSSGKPPRRGVHIPLPPHAYARIEAQKLAASLSDSRFFKPAPSKVERIITNGKRLLEVAKEAGASLFKRLVRKVAAKLS